MAMLRPDDLVWLIVHNVTPFHASHTHARLISFPVLFSLQNRFMMKLILWPAGALYGDASVRGFCFGLVVLNVTPFHAAHPYGL
jgi:hypothetical protein